MAYVSSQRVGDYGMDLQIPETWSLGPYDRVVVQQGSALSAINLQALFTQGTAMGLITFNQLPLATDLDGSEYVPIVQNGSTKRLLVSTLLGRTPAPPPVLGRPAPVVSTDIDEVIDAAVMAVRGAV